MSTSLNTSEPQPSRIARGLSLLTRAIDVLEIPGKVLNYGIVTYGFLGLVLWPLLGWLPIGVIYLVWGFFTLAGGGIATMGLCRWLPSKRWIALLVLIITVVFSISLYWLIPPKARWNRIDMIALARKGQAVPPPFNIIQPILWGEDYPGGSTFQDKVRRWRAAPNDYEQWVVFASTKMPPNRVPRSIALKDPSLRATIGIYVFSDWTIKDVLGFDTRYTQVRLGANTELGRECFVVVFVFPFSKEAANALQESPDEILAY